MNSKKWKYTKEQKYRALQYYILNMYQAHTDPSREGEEWEKEVGDFG